LASKRSLRLAVRAAGPRSEGRCFGLEPKTPRTFQDTVQLHEQNVPGARNLCAEKINKDQKFFYSFFCENLQKML